MDPINWKFYQTNHLILYMTLHLHERNFTYLFYKIYCIEHNYNQYINTFLLIILRSSFQRSK